MFLYVSIYLCGTIHSYNKDQYCQYSTYWTCQKSPSPELLLSTSAGQGLKGSCHPDISALWVLCLLSPFSVSLCLPTLYDSVIVCAYLPIFSNLWESFTQILRCHSPSTSIYWSKVLFARIGKSLVSSKPVRSRSWMILVTESAGLKLKAS